MLFQIGDEVQQTARIVDVRQGGMGVVYVCKGSWDEIDGTFAIKTYLDFEEKISGSVPSRVLTSCRERLKRLFWQECVINLDLPLHPNIVTTYAVNRLNGVPYILMEFVDGTSLREVIAHGPLPVSSVVSYVCQLAEGLKCAFSRNVLHRDIKPENILLTSVGTIKIADFGLAKSITNALMHEVATSDTRQSAHAYRARFRYYTIYGTGTGARSRYGHDSI